MDNFSILTFIVLYGLSTVHACYADQRDIKKHYAKQFVQLLGFEKNFEKEVADCALSSESPTEVIESDKNHYAGITPTSEYWPEVEAIVNDFNTQRCSYMTKEQYGDFFVDKYASLLTVEELKKIVDFYNSSEGLKLIDVSDIVSTKFLESTYELRKKNGQKALKFYQLRMNKLAQKFQNLNAAKRLVGSTSNECTPCPLVTGMKIIDALEWTRCPNCIELEYAIDSLSCTLCNSQCRAFSSGPSLDSCYKSCTEEKRCTN